eukprot:746457-Hanusia_phi.AAC.1
MAGSWRTEHFPPCPTLNGGMRWGVNCSEDSFFSFPPPSPPLTSFPPACGGWFRSVQQKTCLCYILLLLPATLPWILLLCGARGRRFAG